MLRTTQVFTQIDKMSLMFLDAATFFVATLIIYQQEHHLRYEFLFEPLFWLSLLTSLTFLYIFGGYELSDRIRFRVLLLRTALSALASLILLGFLSFALFGHKFLLGFDNKLITSSVGLFFILSSGPRLSLLYFERHLRKNLNLLFIADESSRKEIIADLRKNNFQGRTHFISPESIDDNVLNLQNWSAIIITTKNKNNETHWAERLVKNRLEGSSIIHIRDFYEQMWQKVPAHFVDDHWFVLTDGFTWVESPIQIRTKRWMDFALATFLLLLTWPIMLISAVLIKLTSPGTIFYKQKRVGRSGKDFVIYKFRSMRNNAEVNGAQWACENDPRVTSIGKWLRLTRIDELPQLFNVIKGDMSFVGPRPERAEFNIEIEKVVPFYTIRNCVRPGITGWAQVKYPYGASIEDSKEKFQYDLYYIKHQNFILDLSVVMKTVSVVLLGKGR